MKREEIHQIAVLGAGLMGHGIAQSFIAGGYPVMLYDIQKSVLNNAEAHIKNSLELFCGAGLIENKDIGSALDRLTCTVDLKQAVEEADFITEAVPEDLARILPLANLIVMAFLFALFRRLSGVVYPVLIVLLALLATLGLVEFIKRTKVLRGLFGIKARRRKRHQ